MPRGSNPEKYLSSNDSLKLKEFSNFLQPEQGVFSITALGVDTRRLGQEFESWLINQIHGLIIEEDGMFHQSLGKLLNKYAHAEKPVLIPCYRFPSSVEKDEEVASNLLFFRDEIIANRLQVFLILHKELYMVLLSRYYDFFSRCHVARLFSDISFIREMSELEEKKPTVPEHEFEKALKELEETLVQRDQDLTQLMKRYFRAANTAYKISKWDTALNFYNFSLDLAKSFNDTGYQGRILGNIGLIFWNKGDLDKAMEFYVKSLTINRQIGYLRGEAKQLGNIGLIHLLKGDLPEALKCHQQALAIHRQIGYFQGEAAQLSNIGVIFKKKGEVDEALKHYQQALTIDQQIGYSKGEAITLGNIGLIFKDKGNLEEAMKYQQQALTISRQISRLDGEANVLGNIGMIYQDKGDLFEAMKYQQQSLAINLQIGHLRDEAANLRNIGIIFCDQGDFDQAMKHQLQALEIDRQVGHLEGEALDLGNIGKVYFHKSDFNEALKYLKQARSIFKQIGMPALIQKMDEAISNIEGKTP